MHVQRYYNSMNTKIIDLPKITDPRGNLTVCEGANNMPFDVKRVYWVYDVPGGESRGSHAHKQCREFIIAVSGSFSVTVDDGEQTIPIRDCSLKPTNGAPWKTSRLAPFAW